MPLIPNSHQVFLIGDYHQHTDLLTEALDEISASAGPASAIMLGDYDIHTASQLSDFIDLLNQYDIDFYLLRGNHDCPLYWQDRGISMLFETDGFHLLKDVDYILWQDKRILTVSGAVSVDRTCIRFDEGNCWPDTEGISPNAIGSVKRAVQADGAFDVLLSHTGPLSDVPITNEFTQSFASTDDALLNDLKQERKTITQLQMASGIKRHYFGHFHQSIQKDEYGIRMQCLNICQVVEL